MDEQHIRIRMLETVQPDIPFLAKPGAILCGGGEYTASANKHGAVSGICSNGERLGVKPGEFEFISAPDWLMKIWEGDKNG